MEVRYSGCFLSKTTEPVIGLKKTPTVIGELLWKPFDIRFRGLLEQLKSHRESVLEELSIWTSRASTEEWQKAALERQNASVERERVKKEHEESAEERQLAQEERRRMAEERQQSAQARQRTTVLLEEVQKAKHLLEEERLG
jgi:NurA-like 5'-3' nuclease